jgi:hypothetical protein
MCLQVQEVIGVVPDQPIDWCGPVTVNDTHAPHKQPPT